jgi:outer membrane lipoprotein-sorting protein
MKFKNCLISLGCATLVIGSMLPHETAAAQLSPALALWLASQTNVQSWSADFLQTRRLKSLTQPLTATGHVWFAAPNRFRWELGHPARTIAVRAPTELLVIYPRLKRVERFPLTGEQTGPWRDALGLLEAGFPRSAAELEAQYKLLSEQRGPETCDLVLQPQSAAARKMMPQLMVGFSTRDYSLRLTELQFADGSTMRNDFTNALLNPQINPDLFSPAIPADYQVVEPLKSQ